VHDLSLITTIAAAFTSAWLLGLLTQRIGLSPIVGYLLAGVVIGPHTIGYVADASLANQLAEVGVILLMFGVGLHFHLKDLLAVRNVAIPGAVGQSLVAALLGLVIFTALGLPAKASLVIGMAMAVASTVVLMRVLMDADALDSPQGHVAVGWLIVEDIFTVILLVVVPVLGSAPGDSAHPAAPASPLWSTLGLALLKLLALVLLAFFVGARVVPWVLVQVARLRSRELFTLTILVFSIAIAAGSYFAFGASMALGAFIAGMMVALSPVSHQAAADAMPLRDAFAVLFFVSVGMLFDPAFVFEHPLLLAAGLGIVLIAKPLAALLIVALMGHSSRTGLTVALGLAQIGEFSFILSDVARAHGIMPDSGHSLLVASAILSITVNPLLFRQLPRIESALRSRPLLWRILNARAQRAGAQLNTPLPAAPSERLAVIVGYGPVGRSVHRILDEAGLSVLVIELNMDTVADLRRRNVPAVFGDASRETILEQAGCARASHVLVTLPHTADRAAVVAAVRNLNPRARIIVRAHYLREREDLELAGASIAVFEEAEAAVALARVVLADAGVTREAAAEKVRDLRLQLIRDNMQGMRARRVRSIMIPWTRVQRLTLNSTRAEILTYIARHRFSRWPVIDPATGRAVGYLFTRDLIAHPDSQADWTSLIRPIESIGPDDDVESTLLRMQSAGLTLVLITDQSLPLGLLTLEDILEQVVGRIVDEYEHDARPLLRTAVESASRAAGVVELTATTRAEALSELASALPPGLLPLGVDAAALALARENELSTDLGIGVALPHARVPGLANPLVLFGRSAAGIPFTPRAQPARLLILLITPLERPEVQLSLLAQIAPLAGDPSIRTQIMRASSRAELLAALSMPPQPL